MKNLIKEGVSFGLTSGTITTLGLMIGLYAETGSKLVVIGGILTIAIADALSDALGVHISHESNKKNTKKQIWESTISTFLAKLIYASTFIIPVLFFNLSIAIFISILYGLIVLNILSIYIAKKNKSNPYKVVGEHLGIAVLVMIITYYLGLFISYVFG
jgi:vacuolar iron transporter family protein